MKKSEMIKKRLDLYINAEEAILQGSQSYQVGSRNLTRADLHEVRMMIDSLQKDLDEAIASENGKAKRRTLGVVFRDW